MYGARSSVFGYSTNLVILPARPSWYRLTGTTSTLGETWILLPRSALTYERHPPHLYLFAPSSVSVSTKLRRIAAATEETAWPRPAATSIGKSSALWYVRLSCPHAEQITRPHVYPPKMWYTRVVSCVRGSNTFSASSPACSLSQPTCIASSNERMYSCESSCRPRTKCLAIFPIELVSAPIVSRPRGFAASERRTKSWYSHVTQKSFAKIFRAPPPETYASRFRKHRDASCAPGSAKCAVSARVWYRHCSADAAKQVFPEFEYPAGGLDRRLR